MEKETHSRHRMVVEEVEIPAKSVDESKVEILEENANVSSEKLTNNKNIQLTDTKPKVNIQDETVEEPAEEPENIDRPTALLSHSQNHQKPKSPAFWILIPGIFILGAILGGVFFYKKGVSSKLPATSTPVPTAATITPTPSASPSSKVDVSEFDVAIFNGSGIAGEASKVKTLLEDAGFTVVSTGNAASYDYTKTIIKAKSSVDDSVIQKLRDVISGSYVVGDSQTLTSSATTDIQVVVGSSKQE